MPCHLRVHAERACFCGLFAGLGLRMMTMIAGLVSEQFLLYDDVKNGNSTAIVHPLPSEV